jgi:hypothetical protein
MILHMGLSAFPVASRYRFLSQEELTRLFSVLPSSQNNMALFVLVVLTTGCR